MVNCINLIIEMSPRFVLGRENVPCVAEVVNRSLKADCTGFTLSFLSPPVCEICKLTWIWLKMSTYKILDRNKETAWTNKYMDVISKDEPFRCESFSFFEQSGRKLIFFFLHKRSIFCSFPNFSWKFNIHSFHRLK